MSATAGLLAGYELTALLRRYEERTDEFADLVRSLVHNIQHARADADCWQDNYNSARERLRQVVGIAGGVVR